MAITYRPSADITMNLDVDAVLATYRRLGGKGIERTYGWTAAITAVVRDVRTTRDS